jgi:radical SAM protein with 4Fe4S-binding SPASM domain
MDCESSFWSKIRMLSNDHFILNGTIELTNQCNARCPYCYIADHTNTNELSTQQILYIIDKLDDSGVLFVNITGGDPFLRGDICEVLEYLFSRSFFFTTIFTNGTNITRAHINLLSKHRKKIKNIRMTAFSHYSDVHDSYMNIDGSLQKIIKTGESLLAEGIRPIIVIPLMDFNLDYIKKTIAYFKEKGFKVGVNTTKVITNANNPEHLKSMISEDFYQRFLRGFNDEELLHARREIVPNERNSLCQGLKNSVMFDSTGNLHPCTSFREFIIGSIFQDHSISEILNLNSEYIELRSMTKKSLFCSSCDKSMYCLPCLARKHSYDKNIDGPFEQSCNLTNALLSICNERGL